jgi:hypothetical protein
MRSWLNPTKKLDSIRDATSIRDFLKVSAILTFSE